MNRARAGGPRCRLVLAGVVTMALTGGATTARAQACRVTWSSVGDDASAIVKAPFDMDGDAVLRTFAAGAAIGASMIWVDGAVDRGVRDHPDDMPWTAVHQFSRLTGWYGASGRNALITAAGLVGVVAAGGAIADDDYVVDTAAIMGESVVFTWVFTSVSKVIFGRRRPYTEAGPHDFTWFADPRHDASLSFPSGHASTAFALAAAAAGRHSNWYVQVPAYLFATSAAVQRIDARKHWTSDVLAGGLLGYAVSAFLVDRYHCTKPAPAPTYRVPLFQIAF